MPLFQPDSRLALLLFKFWITTLSKAGSGLKVEYEFDTLNEIDFCTSNFGIVTFSTSKLEIFHKQVMDEHKNQKWSDVQGT